MEAPCSPDLAGLLLNSGVRISGWPWCTKWCMDWWQYPQLILPQQIPAPEPTTVLSFGLRSEFLPITASIIQGSGIGPVAYILNASDLHPIHQHNTILKYADDRPIHNSLFSTFSPVPYFKNCNTFLIGLRGSVWRRSRFRLIFRFFDRRDLLFQFRLQIFWRRIGIFSLFFLCCFYFLLKVHVNFSSVFYRD